MGGQTLIGLVVILWQIAKETQVPFIVNANRVWQPDGFLCFHSLILVTPESGVDQAYDKQYLAIDTELRPRVLRIVDWLRGQVNLGPALAVGSAGKPFLLKERRDPDWADDLL